MWQGNKGYIPLNADHVVTAAQILVFLNRVDNRHLRIVVKVY